MSGYDYPNARLRAMKSRLLSQQQIHALTGAENLEDLLAMLLDTPYQSAIGMEMMRLTNMEIIARALKRDLVDTARKIRRFFDRPEERLVNIMLGRHDTLNVKTILRGLSTGATVSDIQLALLPIGELTEAVLSELANTSNPRAAIDLMATMRLPQARSLLALRAEQPGADTADMDKALERWHFDMASEELNSLTCRGTNRLRSELAIEADFYNLIILTRVIRDPLVRVRFQQNGTQHGMFIGPGHLSFALLARAGQQNTLENAIDILRGTRYETPLTAGLRAFHQTNRLSDLERHLRHFRLRWRAGLIIKDSLGIGVLVGYLALKENEIGAIRQIAYGITVGMGTMAIQSELEFVA